MQCFLNSYIKVLNIIPWIDDHIIVYICVLIDYLLHISLKVNVKYIFEEVFVSTYTLMNHSTLFIRCYQRENIVTAIS